VEKLYFMGENGYYFSQDWHHGRKGVVMLKESVETALGEIKPSLQADGGDVELVEASDETGVVKVRLTGACSGCPMGMQTLKQGIERLLKQKVPEVKEVVRV
jgi:Fe-S cluster biogenesis protein NfuA